MANELKYSRLGASTDSFSEMIQRFGVVTVMNAKVYEAQDVSTIKCPSGEFGNAGSIIYSYEHDSSLELCELDTLKIANVTQEGPTKTITGGQYSNPLIKFGKSARLEMQDALGNAVAIDALCGGIMESTQDDGQGTSRKTSVEALHVGEDFSGPKCIIGDTFFIHQKTGAQVKAKIIFYQFLPDSLFNLTQDAEGDATVFDMNGDLLTTEVKISNNEGNASVVHGVFYSIVDPAAVKAPASN